MTRGRLCELPGWGAVPIPSGYYVAKTCYAGCEDRYFSWLGRDVNELSWKGPGGVLRGKIIRIIVDGRLDRYLQSSTGYIELVGTDG